MAYLFVLFNGGVDDVEFAMAPAAKVPNVSR